MTEKKDLRLEYWCYSSQDLEDIFEKFKRAFPVNEAEVIHDAENVWEWIEGPMADGQIEFNLCRPHETLDDCERRPIATAPIEIALSIHNSGLSPEEIGLRLASVLQCDVHRGEVNYLAGDDREFHVQQTFAPATGTNS